MRTVAPEYIKNRYLKGQCGVIALVIADKTRLPLFGMQDLNGDIHHVFVGNPEQDYAIDIRGILNWSELCQGSVLQDKPYKFVELSKQDVIDVFGVFERSEFSEARKAYNNYIKPIYHTYKRVTASSLKP